MLFKSIGLRGRFDSPNSPQARLSQRIPQWDSAFIRFHCRENRRSLAIKLNRKEIAYLGALVKKTARCCGGAVKIAATAAENRAIF